MRHPDERRPWHEVRYPNDPAKQYLAQKLANELDALEASEGREEAEAKWADAQRNLSRD